MFSHKNENDGAELRVELDTVSGKHQVTVIDANGRDSHAKFHPEATRALAKKLGESASAENERLAAKIKWVMEGVATVERKAAESVAIVNDAMQERAAALAALELQKSKTEQAEAKIAELQAKLDYYSSPKVPDTSAEATAAKNPFDAIPAQ